MKFKINAKPFAQKVADILKRKTVSLTSNQFRMQSAQLYAELIEPYVPKKTGKLRNSVTIVRGGTYLRYNTNYAQRVYEVPARRYTTPGTTHHWDEYAAPNIMDKYKAALNQMAREYMSREK